ncbi:prolyl-tRNA synthetase [Enterobacter cloacae]|uniref:Prolyl-tRNA synthetase n=1 Tax=Enterobacter cloacae TaxID=550 RepID=A0A377M6K0_ENTCL|nr:prolyl-tRNA synthetase [Enterobacter cloacae]
MSLQSVQQFFADNAPDIEIIELSQSTATVALAAAAHRVEPGQIAKTLSLKVKNEVILVVAKGDARLDNKKLKDTFGAKARMLSSDEVVTITGHPVGGSLSVRAGKPTFCLLRYFVKTVRGSAARRRCHPQRRTHFSRPDG